MVKAVYPGSFDPLSNGHLDIIKRASALFDELHIVISTNIAKKYSFSIDERFNMVELVTKKYPNVIVRRYDGLIDNYCKENDIKVIVRGMRNYSDYETEFSLFQYNRDIYPKVETVLMLPTTKNQTVSSTAIKELLAFGQDISKYVPHEIKDIIIERLKK